MTEEALTAEAISAMTPQQAGDALAKMTIAPPPAADSPEGARARLAGLQNDQEWLGKYFGGSPAAAKELNDLLERSGSDRTDRLMAGVVNPLHWAAVDDGISERETVAEISRLRSTGLDDAAIAQLLRGEPLATAAEYRAVQAYERALLGDSDFVKSFLAGEQEAVREMTLVKIALNAGFKEAA